MAKTPTTEPTTVSTLPNILHMLGTKYKAPGVTMRDVIHRTGQTLGYGPVKIPGVGVTIPASPVRGFATTTGLGLLGGWLAGKLYSKIRGGSEQEKRKRVRRWTILGGLATGLPAAGYSAAMAIPAWKDKGWRGLLSYPDIQKAGSAESQFALSLVMTKKAQAGMFPVQHSMGLIRTDPMMTPVQKALAMNIIYEASGQQPRGLLSVGDLVKGALGAGLGYGLSIMVARTMNALLGLPTPLQKILHATGGIGGALVASGLNERLVQ